MFSTGYSSLRSSATGRFDAPSLHLECRIPWSLGGPGILCWVPSQDVSHELQELGQRIVVCRNRGDVVEVLARTVRS